MFETDACSSYMALPLSAVNPGIGQTQKFIITVYPPDNGGKSFFIVSSTNWFSRTYFSTTIKGAVGDVIQDNIDLNGQDNLLTDT